MFIKRKNIVIGVLALIICPKYGSDLFAADALDLREYSKKNSEKIVKILQNAKVEMSLPPEEVGIGGHGKKASATEKLYIVNLVYCVKQKGKVLCDRPAVTGKPAQELYDIAVKEKVKVGKPGKGQTSIFIKELICLPAVEKFPASCRGETHYKK